MSTRSQLISGQVWVRTKICPFLLPPARPREARPQEHLLSLRDQSKEVGSSNMSLIMDFG